MSNRIVHTGLYGKTARETIVPVIRRIIHDHGCKARTERIMSIVATEPVVADDNEIVLSVGTHYDRRKWKDVPSFQTWSDKQVLEHFAWLIKCHVMPSIKLRTTKGWKRSNDETAQFLGEAEGTGNAFDLNAKVCDIYLAYDVLRGRKLSRCWSEAQKEAVIGKPLDPISTEMKIAQKQEIEKLKTALSDELRKLDSARYEKIEAVRKAICVEIEELKEAAKKRCEAKIKEIEEMLDAPMAALLTGASLGA